MMIRNGLPFLFYVFLITSEHVSAFVVVQKSRTTSIYHHQLLESHYRRQYNKNFPSLCSSSNNNNENKENNNNNKEQNGDGGIDNHKKNSDDHVNINISSRFTAPRIDDPGLPIADAITAGFAAPSIYVLWLGLTHSRTPSWLIGASPMRGSLVAPTLSHGAGLACCWLLGALASRSYERPAFDLSSSSEGGIGGGYKEVLARVLKGGAFATGLLIFATQLDLFLEFGRKVEFGESEEIDLRLLTATVELISDVVYEALAIISWRLYLASQSSSRIER
mmetsp:Transcript_24969/g.35220  ORF Transcript_24969/g.35220 Transcript_24969/m.35220 type:complete len:278 (+) Transcript_24969:384-1217(+)